MVVTDKRYWRKKNVLFLEIVMMSTTNVFRSRIGSNDNKSVSPGQGYADENESIRVAVN